jgi:hypothetical protein
MHTIRLGSPWDVTAVEGGTRHARKFGRPRTLEADERVWLVCDRVPGAAEVRVNSVLVAQVTASEPVACDITHLLQPRNEVVILAASVEPLGAVTLEIRGQ